MGNGLYAPIAVVRVTTILSGEGLRLKAAS
jgi:hypothetical protein